MRKLSLCMIAKNEADFLDRCLTTVAPLVDEILVVDTDSNDNTVEVAKKHGATVGYFEWCDDFAAARNAALELVTGDWVLQLDCDEVIAPKDFKTVRRVLKAPARIMGAQVPIRNYYKKQGEDLVYDQILCTGDYPEEETGAHFYKVFHAMRLFRRDSRIRYSNRVHETPEDSFRDNSFKHWRLTVPVHHFGTLLKDRPVLRYNPLVEKWIKAEPENWKPWLLLARELFIDGKHHQALQTIEKGFGIINEAGLFNKRHFMSIEYLNIYGRLLLDFGFFQEASEVLQLSARLHRKDITAVGLLAKCYSRMGDNLNACLWAKQLYRMAPHLPDAKSNWKRVQDYIQRLPDQKRDEFVKQLRKARLVLPGTTDRIPVFNAYETLNQ